ncbi:MAG: bifunctional phosphoribosylaminoimidazolecarboxamide formyltransferase/IMP cyclohydrolase [Chloroflexota bacterium]|nr:bifunctional phosphoribosylaminoimidazolecarboxamide formyltransferase/IMP cyclohydrolase [Chloroflexota bacterium]
MIQRALLSVADKSGLAAFASGLATLGVELISTGGTAKALRAAGLAVTDVAQVTGFPEMLGGRVKTLHPAIHAGILNRRTPQDLAELSERGIAPIDLVVVNLYPFQAAVARPNVILDEAIEEIDIGGVTLLRAAAKNSAHVGVVVNPADYAPVLQELRGSGELSLATRQRLAYAAFAHTAAYDAAISNYLFRQGFAGNSAFPPSFLLAMDQAGELRYGENPHQRAALYRQPGAGGVAWGQLIHGKELSFNNLQDLSAAWDAVSDFREPAAVIVKHATPCGAATAPTLAAAYELAFQGDRLSAFGGILGCNRPVDGDTAHAVGKLFLECIAAPGFTPEAEEILARKKDCRLLVVEPERPGGWDYRRIGGGLLLQDADAADQAEWRVVSRRAPTSEEMASLRFAWTMVRHVRSNAIALACTAALGDPALTASGAPSARGLGLVGVGGGQTSRVDAVEMAMRKAADRARGAVLASDAFFPFRDGVDVAAWGGVTAIVQPGGSKQDLEAIAAADEHDMAMVFTGVRHFRH